MSVQRFDSYGYMPNPEGKNMRYDDHARIVAEAVAEVTDALIASKRGALAEMEQAHAAALAAAVAAARAEVVTVELVGDYATGYNAGLIEGDAKGRREGKRLAEAAAAPRTLTRDGWWPFGSFVDYDFPLEFDGEGEDGLPIWERPDKSRMQPRTLTADDPEPAVVSVVLDKDGTAGQRVYTDDGVTTIWQFSDDDWCHEWGTVDRVRGPITLIHDGEDR